MFSSSMEWLTGSACWQLGMHRPSHQWEVAATQGEEGMNTHEYRWLFQMPSEIARDSKTLAIASTENMAVTRKSMHGCACY